MVSIFYCPWSRGPSAYRLMVPITTTHVSRSVALGLAREQMDDSCLFVCLCLYCKRLLCFPADCFFARDLCQYCLVCSGPIGTEPGAYLKHAEAQSA